MVNLALIESTVKASGLTYEETAHVMRITRNTLSNWRKGRIPRVDIQVEFAMYQIKKIIAATQAGMFPLVLGLQAETRRAMIHHILKSI